MLKLISKFFPPVIPIIYIDSKINQSNSLNLINKISQSQFLFAKGFALVVSIQNSMPVQVDKIVDRVKQIKETFKIPVYGFCLDQCSSLSYYMVSIADQVYALKSTTFQLKKNQSKMQLDGLLESCGVKKTMIRSNQNLSGAYSDRFSSANTSHFMNTKATNLSQRLYKYAIQNRLLNKNTNKKLSQKIEQYDTIPRFFMGQKAVQSGFIDKIGSHYQVLHQKHPNCRFKIIKLLQQPIQVKQSIGLLTSPILVLLLIFKIILKYSIIMYLYLKSQKKQKIKQQSEALIQK